MLVRWIVAAFHLLALGIGLGGVWVRARALRHAHPDSLRSAFAADTAWGLAAALWISTGFYRVFGGLEKGSAYYLGNTAFHIKITLLVVILGLEILPMLTLIRWRRELRRGATLDLSRAPLLSRISVIQAALIVGMVLAATATARGFGA